MNGIWATGVGSFPRPPELLRALADHAAGRLTDLELRELQRQATEDWIHFQEDIGVDLLVDGQVERGDTVTFFAEQLSGFEIGGLVRIFDNHYYRRPIAVGEVARTRPIAVEGWKFAQSLTKKPVKAVVTGPYTIASWSLDEHYDTRREFVLDVARAIHAEALDLVAAGARFVQIDEPAATARLEDMPLVAEALRIVTRDVDAHTILHVCHGNFQPALGALFELPVDQLDLSLSRSAERMLPRIKRLRSRKLLGVGLLDAHGSRVETPEEIVAGLGFALDALPADHLFVAPDCGLKTRSVAEARSKMRAMVEAVARVREARRIGGELPTRDPSGRPWPGPLPLPDRV
ncbi:MAG TPA: hypothetical protein VNF73_12830 [Candidatus Saccharimonadales bacterium]|nr:hypothetical protein [Candidatus Saccharimonadales bacterium]